MICAASTGSGEGRFDRRRRGDEAGAGFRLLTQSQYINFLLKESQFRVDLVEFVEVAHYTA